MVHHRSEIAHVNPAAADRALYEMLGVLRWFADPLSDDFASRYTHLSFSGYLALGSSPPSNGKIGASVPFTTFPPPW
jgi:hypothetical protein